MATGFFEAKDHFNSSLIQVDFFRELLEDGVQVAIALYIQNIQK